MRDLDPDAFFAEARPGDARAAEVALALELEDRIGDWFVVAPVLRLVRDDDVFSTRVLRHGDGVSVEVVGGEAEIREDPYRGYTLVRPTSDEPVVAQGLYRHDDFGSFATAPRPIAYRVDNVPPNEQAFVAAGGGACAAVVVAAQAEVGIEVRAAIQSNVMPLSPTERELHWRHGLYFAYDPAVGFMRLQYNPDYRSHLTLSGSGDGNGSGAFFPATAQNELYFILDFVDLGLKTFNKKPMRQRVDIAWPPFEDAVLAIEEPVEFFDLDNPATLVMRLVRQEMRLYDYESLSVEILGQDLSPDGRLKVEWRITNQADVPVRTRWFLLGDFTGGELAHEGNRLLGPSGDAAAVFEATTEVHVPEFSLPQRLSLACVTLTDPILAGMAEVTFSHPG